MGGKSIVAVGDTSSCGSKYLKISDLAVMSSGASSPKIVSNNTLYTTNFTEPLSYQDSAFLKLPKFP